MDPLTAIGLVANIIAFVDAGRNVVSAAKSIRDSASGATSANASLTSMTEQLSNSMSDLKLDAAGVGKSDQEESLADLAVKTQEIGRELLDVLQSLRAKNPSSKRSVFKAAFKDVVGHKKVEVKELESRLTWCKQQVVIELAKLTRYIKSTRIQLRASADSDSQV